MKIQLKRSNVLELGSAKEPTKEQMEYGELAVNYNSSDPAIFVKASDGAGNDSIVRIAGTGAIGQPDFDDGDGSTYDERYVKVVGDNMTGNLTLGTNKITLKTDGSADFKGRLNTVKLDNDGDDLLAQFKVEANGSFSRLNSLQYKLDGTLNLNGAAALSAPTVVISAADGSASFAASQTQIFSGGNQQWGGNGYDGTQGSYVSKDGTFYATPSAGTEAYLAFNEGSSSPTVTINGDGSAAFVGKVTAASTEDSDGGNVVVTKDYLSGSGSGGTGALGYWNRTSTTLSPVNAGDSLDIDGSAVFKGDVAIGDSTTFFGTIGDAVALLPNSIVDQFKVVIDGLPQAQPYDATTLPADLPTPLKDALVRATTAGKINLNSDGSASFASTVSVGNDPFPGTATGSALYSDGSIALSSANSTGTIFFGYTTGNSTPTTLIKGDGSASFVGTTSYTGQSGNVFIDVAGSAARQFGFKFDQIGWLTSKLSIVEYNSSGIETERLAIEGGDLSMDGSATFVGGEATINEGGKLDLGVSKGQVLVRADDLSSTAQAFAVYDGSWNVTDEVVRISHDGSALFKGKLNVVKLDTDSDNLLCQFKTESSDGTRQNSLQFTTAGDLLLNSNSSDTTPNVKMNANTGIITASGYSLANLDEL